MLTGDVLFFFEEHKEALPIYEAFDAQVEALGEVHVRVQKTQITFSSRRVFACVSFLPVKKAKDRPKVYLTVTFGLARRLDSPRIDIATEPYPGRWTHHILLSDPMEVDEELMGWVREAFDFSESKR